MPAFSVRLPSAYLTSLHYDKYAPQPFGQIKKAPGITGGVRFALLLSSCLSAPDRVHGDDIRRVAADEYGRNPFEHKGAFGGIPCTRPVVVPVCAADMRRFGRVASACFPSGLCFGIALANNRADANASRRHRSRARRAFCAQRGRRFRFGAARGLVVVRLFRA